MVKPRKGAIKAGFCRYAICLFIMLAGSTWTARAAIQFDVFPGYESVIPEASWFPIVCEVKNDGPTFTGVIEVTAGNFNQSLTRRMVLELPTGTLKRVTLPVFSSSRYLGSWDVRLLDARGKTHAESLGMRPKREASRENTVLAGLPRTVSGMPTFRPIMPKDASAQPVAVRMQSQLMPDNPLSLEGLDCVYLNSEKAIDLSKLQVEALLGWLNAGGHLVLGIEEVTDFNSTPWLRTLVPLELSGMDTVTEHSDLQKWVQSADGPKAKGWSAGPFANLNPDADFEGKPLLVAKGVMHGGRVLAKSGDTPMLVRNKVGMGQVTTLLFSPEREPMKSWKNLPTFWSKIAEVSPTLYTSENFNQSGGWSIDGVFGAMIDSKQIRKLPVEWLLLLLIVYLVVIGPLDQYWLKKIKKPMLTWITFPCYVVLFSVLIYFIGYKLRAGESEWNELHVVDVLANGEGAELRGRTYASIYSPVNAKYRVDSQEQFATFRGEFLSSWSGGQESERADVLQNGDNFKAEIFVPVWTSQLYISDWWQPASLPLKMTIAPSGGGGYSVSIYNRLEKPISQACVVIEDRFVELGEVLPGQTKQFTVNSGQGLPLKEFVRRHGSNFQNATSSRQRAFGGNARILDIPNSTMAISFISQLSADQNNNAFRFVTPPGLDLTPVIEHGNAVLLAWSSDYSPIKPMNQFSPKRNHKDTLWRVTVPLPTDSL